MWLNSSICNMLHRKLLQQQLNHRDANLSRHFQCLMNITFDCILCWKARNVLASTGKAQCLLQESFLCKTQFVKLSRKQEFYGFHEVPITKSQKRKKTSMQKTRWGMSNFYLRNGSSKEQTNRSKINKFPLAEQQVLDIWSTINPFSCYPHQYIQKFILRMYSQNLHYYRNTHGYVQALQMSIMWH